MSGYILCQVKKAEKPFYIENISTNIYSIEELCYYLSNNLYLIDYTIALMENRMYVNAIRVYQKLLEKDSREISREMRERILHNQGCAYSYLFQMDKALDCFFAAWKVNQSEKALKIYLLAYRSVHTPEEFEKIQEDLKAEDSVKKETARALEQFISLPEQKIAPGETDRILEDLTREYHRSTGS